MTKNALADCAYWIAGFLKGLRLLTPPQHWRLGDKAPVILLSGWMTRWSTMAHIGNALSDAGHPVHIVPGLGYNLKSLPNSTTLLARVIESRNLNNVALIGFSKGGLIGKYYMTKMNVAGRVAGLVSIATPYAGSLVSHRVVYRSARELARGAPAIAELAADATPHSRMVCILATNDVHAGPGAAAKLEGATNIVIPVDGHNRVLFDPRTRDVAVAAAEELQRLAHVDR